MTDMAVMVKGCTPSVIYAAMGMYPPLISDKVYYDENGTHLLDVTEMVVRRDIYIIAVIELNTPLECVAAPFGCGRCSCE